MSRQKLVETITKAKPAKYISKKTLETYIQQIFGNSDEKCVVSIQGQYVHTKYPLGINMSQVCVHVCLFIEGSLNPKTVPTTYVD